MGKNDSEAGKAPVPLYAKIGWVLAWVVMVVIVAMILRNCANAVIYGAKTGQQTVDSYYTLGLEDGRAGRGANLQGEGVSNPVLRKAYNKGFRDGVDQGTRQGEQGRTPPSSSVTH